MTTTTPPPPKPVPTDPATPPSSAVSGRPSLRGVWEATGMLLVFVLLVGACSAFVPNFASWVNFKFLLLSVTTVGIIACTMLFCLATGDVDLSVGSTVAMSGVLAAVVANQTGSVAMGVAAGVLAGGLVGLFNGVVIARLGVNALIATLATMQIVKGLGFIICNGNPVGIRNPAFYELGIGTIAGVPVPIWVMLACFVIFGVLLNKTTFGRNTLAVGGNSEAARLAGIGVVSLRVVIFTLQGLAAGFAGVILAARMSSGQPKPIEALELDIISACVLGGVSLTGGVGTISGVIIGVLIMGVVRNAMNLRGIETFYQYVVSGAVLLAAVLLDRLRTRST